MEGQSKDVIHLTCRPPWPPVLVVKKGTTRLRFRLVGLYSNRQSLMKNEQGRKSAAQNGRQKGEVWYDLPADFFGED